MCLTKAELGERAPPGGLFWWWEQKSGNGVPLGAGSQNQKRGRKRFSSEILL